MRPDAFDTLWIGFTGLDGDEGGGPLPGGYVLFGRNLDPDPEVGPLRCFESIRALRAKSAHPLAMALDQEGGAVSRLKVWVGETPSLHAIWTRGGAEGCTAWGRLWGRGLAMLGFNVDFAPVADLWDGQPGTGLGNRAASENPYETATAAGAFLDGLRSHGVRGCLKHFPGLGGTRVDSHQSLPELKDMAQINANLKPFRSLCHVDRLTMVAHVKTPGTCGLPASLHRGSVQGNPWGIQARWIPDDLEMGACTAWDWPERVSLCLDAGHQALLVCQTPEGIQACADAVAQLPESVWQSARERFLAMNHHLTPAPEGFDADAFKRWLDEVRAASAALAY